MTMNLVLSLAAGLGVAVLYWKKPVHAVAAVVMLAPTYLVRFSALGIPLTMLESTVLGVSLACGVNWLLRRTIGDSVTEHEDKYLRTRTIALQLIGILLVASILSLLTTPTPIAGLGLFKAYILEPILFFCVFLYTVRTPKDLHVVFRALCISALVISGIAVVQYITGIAIPEPWTALPGRRSTAVYGFPNAIGLFVAPIVAGCVAFLVHGTLSKSTRILYTATAVLGILALFTARVEGALIAVLAAIAVMLLFTKYRVHTVAAACVLLASALAIPATRALLLFQNVSGDVRLALWKGTWNLLSAQPLFGSGLGGFPITYDLYRLPSHVELLLYPHNLFLNFWTQLGALGLFWILFVLATVVVIVAMSLQKKQMLAFVLLAVFVVYVVYGLVDVVYFKNDLSLLFWMWLGWACVLYRARGN